MQLLLRIILAVILGYAVGWGVSVAAGFRYIDALHPAGRDDGLSMGIMFGIGPFIGGITALVALAMVAFKELQRRSPGHVDQPLPAALKVVGGLLTICCVYLMVWFVIEVTGPFQLGAPWQIVVTEGIPVLAALIAGWLVVKRMGATDDDPRLTV
jgi:hypothetical protein